ncbi:MAG: cyclopropane-fatty-acyl-phospholipid synthase family protein [Pseudomonadota bacterium]
MTSVPLTSPILVRSDSGSRVFKGVPVAARAMLKIASSIEFGSLDITLPDNRTFRIEGFQPGPHGELHIHDYAAITRVLKASDVGFGEAFMAGEWSSPDVTLLLEVMVRNHHTIMRRARGNPIARLILRFRHWLNRNTPSGSKRNISAHYDLGNAFYEKWLDSSMTYSSAYFGGDSEDLTAAQTNKYRKLAEDVRIGAGDKVLEIGCGWGGFAEFAAREFGCSVTGLTISREQYDFARKRIHEAGLNDKVTIKFQDYRHETGQYDRIVSIEMFEAVGEKYWPVFFDKMRNCLKDDGIAGLQVIAIQDRMFEAYRTKPDFIQRYIFPGGMLPTPSIMRDLGEKVGMSLTDQTIFGLDYARTLSEWRERFDGNWPAIKPLGFDERFKKLWQFYLHYCEAGFRAGNIDVRHMIFARR